jgi:RNA polymerase sigma-70 factor (ECF subfamily)
MDNTPPAHNPFQDRILPHLPQLRARAASLNQRPCDAEDLVQDTIERALRKASSFQAQPVPSRWLMRVMYNRFADEWRQRTKVRALAPLDEANLASPAPYEPQAWEMVTDGDIQKAVSQLPPALQTIVRMSVVEKRSYREISSLLRIPLATVATRLHRARLRMKRILSSTTPLVSDRAPKKATTSSGRRRRAAPATARAKAAVLPQENVG